jgi:citrate synthase
VHSSSIKEYPLTGALFVSLCEGWSRSINSIDMRKRRPPASRRLVTAEAAVAALGISRRTLYSYVSRGLIGVSKRSVVGRGSLYDAADVEVLRDRQRRGRSHAAIAASTIEFGEPVLQTGLTRIESGRLSYSGRDAVALSEDGTLEDVAGLLWSMSPPPEAQQASLLAPVPGSEFVDRCARAVADALHLGKTDASPRLLQQDAARLLYIVAGAACGRAGRWPPGRKVHEGFAEHWKVDAAGEDVLRRCLVLIADHELPASTYSARVAASTGASLGACILAALCTFSGRMHGGAIDYVRALLTDREVLRDPERWAVHWRDSGQKPLMVPGFPGFGHRLYPDGDPRAEAILRFLTLDPESSDVAAAMQAAVGLPPSIDFALLAVERNLRLPPFAANALFVTGRTVGWIAHALEQRREGGLIRPRAVYREQPEATLRPQIGLTGGLVVRRPVKGEGKSSRKTAALSVD